MRNEDAFLHYLGLAHRAGQVVSGTDAVYRQLTAGVCLLILARDASERTVRHWEQTAAKAGVAMVRAATRVSLGNAIGKSPKAVVAVKEDGFCALIVKAMGDPEKAGGVSVQSNGRGLRSTDRSDA